MQQEAATPVAPDGTASAPRAAESRAGPESRQRRRRPRYEDQPARRPLQIYSFDPMLANTLERIGPGTVTVAIPWEPLDLGPSGARVQVIDFDSGRTVNGKRELGFYEPVNLDRPRIAVQAGLPPSEGDPRFHQQMVYAVAMRTFEAFDKALGRRVRPSGGRLRLFPHAFRGRNAYYDPERRAILFGYFEADRDEPGANLPGQFVFTCLSHDIIAHEVTHALLHRIRPWLLDQTNRDVAAFHEAIADVTAIFLHFTLPGVVEDTIAATRTRLTNPTPLAQLAQQFGYATGGGSALRSAIDVPDTRLYQVVMEPHDRGAILVAAVFEAFTTVYQRRIADLLRLATGGSGVLPRGSLHPDLVSRVSREAIRTADQILTMCLRALDYLPPVDVTFADFLRAIVTSDRELFPTDGAGLRAAFIDAFRRRGIYPEEVLSLADAELVWSTVDEADEFALDADLRADILALDTLGLDPWRIEDSAEPGQGSSPAGTGTAPAPAMPRVLDIRGRLEQSLKPHAKTLQLGPKADIQVEAFQSMFRYDEDGAPHLDFVVQCLQRLEEGDAPRLPRHILDRVVRRSSAVVFDESGWIRYVISKPLPAAELPESTAMRAAKRLDELGDWMDELESRDVGLPFGLRPPGGRASLRINFGLLHQGSR